MKSLIIDKRGISEEFTSLPALMVVMIGFALFFAMIAGVYHTHNERVENKELYEVAHYTLMKLTSGESPLVSEKGGNTPIIMDEQVISTIGKDVLKDYCNPLGYDYTVKFYWYDEKGGRHEISNPNMYKSLPSKNRLSSSREIAIKFSEGDIRIGKIVVIIWRR